VTLGPRDGRYVVLKDTNISAAGAASLALSSEECWYSMLERDIGAFAWHVKHSFEAQVAMFPHMADDSLRGVIEKYRYRALGWKLSGAGGGGYLILVAERRIPGTMGIKIRRP
jgi:galactokinase/mevalonate kinase-like predicted kinase